MDPVSFAIMTVAQIGLSYLFPAEGPRLKDLKVSASSYGAAIPWVFGLTRVPGNMIWCNPIREKKKKQSGKGGSYNQYTYFCTFAMGLCKGPVRQIRRVWADNKLIYDASGGVSAVDASNPSTVKQAVQSVVGGGAGGGKYRFRFYNGDEDQLPDSAIEAQLGEGNTPAFRGLSYILFDDMALEDFGNRIPQITAEVMVGEIDTNVVVSPFTEQDGIEDLDGSYAVGESAFDFQRSIVYLRYNNALKGVSLTDAKARFEFDGEDFSFPVGEKLSRLLCSGSDGSLFVMSGVEGALTTLARLDAFSLQAVQTQTGVPAPIVATTAPRLTGDPVLLTVSEDGQARQFSALDLTPGPAVTLPGSGFKIVGRDADTSNEATFFALHRETPTTMNLTRIKGSVVDVVYSFEANDPGPVLWDSAMPGVIFYYTVGYGGAQTRHLAKWSEDTNSIAWTRSVPALPPRFSPNSRLLVSQLGWLSDGRLFTINTATGESTDGADAGDAAGLPDWTDYLARYPEVLTDYYNGGWDQAPTPEEYAQVDYMLRGESEGRTVNYVQSTQGTGIGLSGQYAGALSLTQAIDASRGVLIALDGINGIIKQSNIATGVTVGTIVARLLDEGGLPLVRTDLTPLYQIPIRGYGWASGTDIKGVFDELRRLFLFDLIEREGMIVAKMRGGDNGLGVPTEIIPQAALGSSGEDANDFWQETRTQEAEIPASMSLSYMNVERDFETTTARSQRITNPQPTMFSRQQVAMEVNMVMTATEAKVQVNRMLYSQWSERTSHTSRLSWAYLNLDPADVIKVNMDDGRSYDDRIHQTEIGNDFVMSFQSYSQDAGAYDGWDAIVGDGGTIDPVVIPTPGYALPFVFNTPLLRDLDDQGGGISLYYVGFGNARSDQAFTGATLFRSTNTVDYDPMVSPGGDVEWATVVGDRLGPPHAGPFAMDWKSRVKLRPAVGWFDITSIDDDLLNQGANLCIIGDEVIQFRDCVENEDGTWTIWNLLRARRGTDYACDNHKAGERFAGFDSNTIGYALDQTSARGMRRSFKAVANGGSLSDAAPLNLVYEPRDLMPYAPHDIRRTVAAGDVTVTWARRTRFGGDLKDGTGVVPLAERAERYTLFIMAAPFAGDLSRGAGPTAYRRMVDLTTPTFLYTAAMQTEDGFNPLTDTLHICVQQLSDAVGGGFPGIRSIEPDQEF